MNASYWYSKRKRNSEKTNFVQKKNANGMQASNNKLISEPINTCREKSLIRSLQQHDRFHSRTRQRAMHGDRFCDDLDLEWDKLISAWKTSVG